MNSSTSTKVKTFIVDAIEMDEKYSMMEQIIEALKKFVNEKDLQITQLMSKLYLYNPRESSYKLRLQKNFDGESLIKSIDNH